MIKYTAITDKGKHRLTNQDSILSWRDDTTGLFMICDGIGGNKAGDKASMETVRMFREAIEQHPKFTTKESMNTWFKSTLDKVNKYIFELGRYNYEYEGMGTTLIAVLIHEDKKVGFNVGDSRLYTYDSTLILLSQDQTFGNEMLARNELSLEEIQIHPKRNMLMNAVGVQSKITYDFIEDLGIYKYILLSSDGLHGYVTQEDIEKCFINDTIFSIRDCLLNKAIDVGGFDNISIILLAGDWHD